MEGKSHDRPRLCAGASAPRITGLIRDDIKSYLPAGRAKTAGPPRTWIERAGACGPDLPVWRSRAAWLADVRTWAESAALRDIAGKVGVSITSATLMSVAEWMAAKADHGTGRHAAVTRAWIAERAGCHANTVSTAWAVLRAGGWAVEAQRGHGSSTTPSVGRRPSVYHLVPRRPRPSAKSVELRGLEPLTSPADVNDRSESVEICDLPPSGGVCSLAPVGSNSPSAHPREEKFSQPSKSRRWRAEPRPVALQRLADALAGNDYGRRGLCRGLRQGHIGAICDALASAGIDPAVWSAKDVQAALEADMRRTGGTWPDQITNPGGFLASRLRRLQWHRAEVPVAPIPARTSSTPQAGPVRVEPTTAELARIDAAREHIRAVLAQRRADRAQGHGLGVGRGAPR